VDEAVSLFTEDGLEGATTPCAVHRHVFRPLCVSAVEIAKFHSAAIDPSFLSFYPLRRIVSTNFRLSFRSLWCMKIAVQGTPFALSAKGFPHFLLVVNSAFFLERGAS